jgi:hypothetical protein
MISKLSKKSNDGVYYHTVSGRQPTFSRTYHSRPAEEPFSPFRDTQLDIQFPPRSFLSEFTLPLIVMLIFPNEHASISEEHYAET